MAGFLRKGGQLVVDDITARNVIYIILPADLLA